MGERAILSVGERDWVRVFGSEWEWAFPRKKAQRNPLTSRKKMKSLTYREKKQSGQESSLLTLNMGRLRTKNKKEPLKAMAHFLRFSVALSLGW